MTLFTTTRMVILSENRGEYLELAFAAAKLGVIYCASNWRFASVELAHCIQLTSPKLALVSSRYHEQLSAENHGMEDVIVLEQAYEEILATGERRTSDKPPFKKCNIG